MSCFHESWSVFFLAHLFTHPLCTCAEVVLLVFVVRHFVTLWRKERVTRGLLVTALGYLIFSIVHQFGGVFMYIVTPAFNLSKHGGVGYCQSQTLFTWSSATLTYPCLVFFWVERLRQTFKGSTFAVRSKIIARIRYIWYFTVCFGLFFSVAVAVEEKCSVTTRVLDYNPFPNKLRFCSYTKRGSAFATLFSAIAAVEILLTQGILGYMYVWRLKAVFVDSGKPVAERSPAKVNVGKLALRILRSKKEQRIIVKPKPKVVSMDDSQNNSAGHLTATSLSYVSPMTPTFSYTDTYAFSFSDLSPTVSSVSDGMSTKKEPMKAKKRRRRKAQMRSTMSPLELDYFRKSAIIALTSVLTTFVSGILFAFANTYYVYFWDLLLNALLITCSFEFGDTIYQYLFCCCHRVCVATVDRVTSMDEIIKETPVLSAYASSNSFRSR